MPELDASELAELVDPEAIAQIIFKENRSLTGSQLDDANAAVGHVVLNPSPAKTPISATAKPRSFRGTKRTLIGLALRITAAGSKSLVWEGRRSGRMRRKLICHYPDATCSIAAARNIAKGYSNIIEPAPIDPPVEPEAPRPWTLRKAADEFFSYRETVGKVRSWHQGYRRFWHCVGKRRRLRVDGSSVRHSADTN